MYNKIISFIRLIIVKIRFKNKLILSKYAYKSMIESCNNITIMNGTIVVKGPLYMKNGATLGVNMNGKIIIGNQCFFNRNSICSSLGLITIGNNCSIGPNVCIYDHDHDFDKNGKKNNEFKIGKVEIGNNVWIGAGVIILRNTKIGDNSVIGAGSVIKGDIPSGSLVTNNREIIIRNLK